MVQSPLTPDLWSFRNRFSHRRMGLHTSCLLVNAALRRRSQRRSLHFRSLKDYQAALTLWHLIRMRFASHSPTTAILRTPLFILNAPEQRFLYTKPLLEFFSETWKTSSLRIGTMTSKKKSLFKSGLTRRELFRFRASLASLHK